MEEGLLKKLMATIKCTVCGQHYEVENIDVLGHHEDLWFLSVLCPDCHARCLVAAVIKEARMPEVTLDLTKAEQDRFRNVGRVTSDDVLDMRNFLKGFDGDFSRLFGQE